MATSTKTRIYFDGRTYLLEDMSFTEINDLQYRIERHRALISRFWTVLNETGKEQYHSLGNASVKVHSYFLNAS